MSRTLEQTLAIVQGVEGWLSPDQVARLHAAAAKTTDGDQIVEIGSFRGRSTIVLAGAASDCVAVVAIDPHAGNDRGPEEISGFAAEAAGDHEIFTPTLPQQVWPIEFVTFASSAARRTMPSTGRSVFCSSTAPTGTRLHEPTSATGVDEFLRAERC
jgi:hypothetical protein